MNFKIILFITINVQCLLLLNADEACNSYAGGQVYPGEGRVLGGHDLHSSKAQSKFLLVTFKVL